MANWLETFEKADIVLSASGDTTVIAAPGDGKYLAIDFIQYMARTAVDVQHKAGATNYGGLYPLDAKQGVTIENSMQNEHGVLTMPNNTAFVMNLSTSASVYGIVRYRIINK